VVHSGCSLWFTLVVHCGSLWLFTVVHSGCSLWFTVVVHCGSLWLFTVVHSGCSLWFTLVVHCGCSGSFVVTLNLLTLLKFTFPNFLLILFLDRKLCTLPSNTDIFCTFWPLKIRGGMGEMPQWKVELGLYSRTYGHSVHTFDWRLPASSIRANVR